jgi:starvation-inducible DNA-binding protein
MTTETLPRSPEDHSRAVAHALQCVLTDLIDLSLIGRHAHWNVRGANFIAVHRLLDELVHDWRELGDEVAERIAALGFSPAGQVERIADCTELDPVPAGPLSDGAVVTLLLTRVTSVIHRASGARQDVESSDAVTDDLISDVLRALEKHRWFLRAQRETGAA